MKQSTVIRLLILGLPIGLIVTGTTSMIWHFNKPKKEQAPRIFTTLAEEITEDTLSGYARNLSEIIGPRHVSSPAALERAANYLESTLGERNIGYQVARQEFEVEGEFYRNLWMEIPGGKRRNECVVLTAHYDASAGQAGRNSNASGVAAIIALAENFIREAPMLTIRLALLTNGTAPHVGTEHSGAAHFATKLKQLGDQVQAVYCLDSIGAFPTEHAAFPDTLASYLPESGPFLTALADDGSLGLLKQTSDTLSAVLPFTVHQAALMHEASSFFKAHDAGPFQALGFPTMIIGGNGVFFSEDLPVNAEKLTHVTRALATLVRVLTNP
ncbi:MAG: hypothetical protein ACI957_004463 [Verrucomicrobiales bacterium]|jgi:hypothetical protein